MAATTTNFSLYKPAVNDPIDADLWGGYLNQNADTIDSALVTRTKDYNFADYMCNRIILRDYALDANGNFPNISGATAINITSTGNVYTGTMTGNVTFTFTGFAPSGKAGVLWIIVKQDGTGGRTITWPTLQGGTPSAPTSGPGKYSLYQFVSMDSGSNVIFVSERLGS